ncbi:MAG: hypothetical protein Q8L37_00530 [Candidatus Gottesmanbacteria bacterium]|nr:hypothetical protein [Candidatus Gottesmanbacteria bacterium]
MRYLDLRKQIEGNYFRILDVAKLFPAEQSSTIRTQLYRFVKKGFISQLKRGLYCFDKSTIDELALAEQLYFPSYVSLETALNYYGIIPDIPMAVSCVTPVTTKKIETGFGVYHYFKVDRALFFGFSQTPFAIAYKEKALLDYFYLRRIRSISPEMRLQLNDWDWKRYREYAVHFPKWIQEIKLS